VLRPSRVRRRPKSPEEGQDLAETFQDVVDVAGKPELCNGKRELSEDEQVANMNLEGAHNSTTPNRRSSVPASVLSQSVGARARQRRRGSESSSKVSRWPNCESSSNSSFVPCAVDVFLQKQRVRPKRT